MASAKTDFSLWEKIIEKYFSMPLSRSLSLKGVKGDK